MKTQGSEGEKIESKITSKSGCKLREPVGTISTKLNKTRNN
jgi:hypothetical protein